MARSKGEEAFIDQKTRQLLVGWADHCIKNETLPDATEVGGDANWPRNVEARDLGMHPVYLDFALSKGWLSKKTPHRLTSVGWKTAASFLRR